MAWSPVSMTGIVAPVEFAKEIATTWELMSVVVFTMGVVSHTCIRASTTLSIVEKLWTGMLTDTATSNGTWTSVPALLDKLG